MHFTLLVAHTNKYNLEDLMEPYWQDTDDPKYVEPEVELKGDKEAVKNFLTQAIKAREEAKEFLEKQEQNEIRDENIEFSKQGIEKYGNWLKRLDEDFDKVKQEIAEYENWEIFDNGDLGVRYNHNMEWDWYSIGGRWDGLYVMKNGDHKNIFLKKDLDLEKTKESEKKRYGEIYDECVKQGKENGWPEENWIWGYDKVPTREKYIEDKVGDDFWVTYGYLDEDWITREQIDDKDGTWAEQFEEWFDSLPDDTELTLVDYHM